jgi:SAM-dependent methyltransferase
MNFPHRETGMKLLSGSGLEIGAMHQPSKIPSHCLIQYLDVVDVDTISELFPEIKDFKITKPDYLGDIEKNSVREITNRQFDFIILNHVLEHVANPIESIKNIYEGIKVNGYFVISIPDKNYTFDQLRSITTFEHLLADYYTGVNSVNNDHYVDFLTYVHPEVFGGKENFTNALNSVRKRREHVHVWDSITFRKHLDRIFNLLNINMLFLFESDSYSNHFEYFAVLKKID